MDRDREKFSLIRQTVRNFITKEVDPLAEQIEETENIPKELLEKAAEIGLFGLSIPEEYGGMGIGMLGKVMVYEELGRSSNAFASVIGCHNGIGTVGIVELAQPGTEGTVFAQNG